MKLLYSIWILWAIMLAIGFWTGFFLQDGKLKRAIRAYGGIFFVWCLGFCVLLDMSRAPASLESTVVISSDELPDRTRIEVREKHRVYRVLFNGQEYLLRHDEPIEIENGTYIVAQEVGGVTVFRPD